MKKSILNISFVILSVLLFYGVFYIFWKNDRLDIRYYYWSKYYKDGSRDYFLTKEEQTLYWEVDFKNPKKEAIYFGEFDYLINDQKDTFQITKKHRNESIDNSNNTFRTHLDPIYSDIIHLNVDNGVYQIRQEATYPKWSDKLLIDLDDFSGEAIKLKIKSKSDWDNNSYSNLIEFTSYGLENMEAISLFDKMKSYRIKPDKFENNNIKLRQTFKNGKPHGSKIIYPSSPFFLDSINIKVTMGRNQILSRKNIPAFNINTRGPLKDKKSYHFIYQTDSIVELYNEGRLVDCKVWSLDYEINFERNRVVNNDKEKVNLKIIKDTNTCISIVYDKFLKNKWDYYVKSTPSNENWSLKFNTPKLIYENNDKNGILNINQLTFEFDQEKIDEIFIKFLIYLFAFLILESLVFWIFIKMKIKLNR